MEGLDTTGWTPQEIEAARFLLSVKPYGTGTHAWVEQEKKKNKE